METETTATQGYQCLQRGAHKENGRGAAECGRVDESREGEGLVRGTEYGSYRKAKNWSGGTGDSIPERKLSILLSLTSNVREGRGAILLLLGRTELASLAPLLRAPCSRNPLLLPVTSTLRKFLLGFTVNST